jgi:hypothetical protein
VVSPLERCNIITEDLLLETLRIPSNTQKNGALKCVTSGTHIFNSYSLICLHGIEFNKAQ